MTSSFIRQILIFLALVAANVAVGDDVFPRPAALERDINFWVSIFTDYSTDEGALHDNRNLAVVYERLPMPESVSRSERNRRVKARRRYYQNLLRTLASGKRENLTAEEARVLALWPEGVSNKTLNAATGRIRFQHGLSDRFREGLVRAGRWRDHIHREFAKRGVPVELSALPHVESSYNPAARSHVGASGIWQFTRSTGRRFMQVDHVLDERNDPFLATEAAAKLLAYNYSITGNWPMAITAYNHGLAGARRAMRQFGDTEYTKILREYRGRTFGFASRNFYVAFLAAMQVDQDPEKYFPGLVPDKPVSYARFRLDAYVPADAMADALGISERQLARYNPALQATVWQGSKHLPKDFEIRVPVSLLDQAMEELVARVAPADRHDRQLPDLYHTVARGDTLSEIADEYRTRVSTLVALNGLSSRHRIRVGQQIRLPAAGPAPVVVASAPQEAPPPAVAPPAETPAAGPEPAADAPEAVAMVVTEDTMEDTTAEMLVDVPEADAVAIAGATDAGGAGQSTILSDPSDYSVAEDMTIEVQPLETLGHYGDWLDLRTQRLRDINGFAFRTPVEVGQRIRIDTSRVNIEDFENRRNSYHRQQQDSFFREHTITGIRQHVVRSGESVWILSLRQYDVPLWLFRQYNPSLDLERVRPGVKLNFPVLERNSNS
ncbi:MAG: LysM peptidoglycan-binding domain-containing protein [Gammaproteobacteria bacterium]|nr:LysM peptidoglycan-binding domain-containing protein [Gammaproteobacteria bacterium]